MSHTDLNHGRTAINGVMGQMGGQTEKLLGITAAPGQLGSLPRLEKQKEKVLIFLTTTALLFFFLAPIASASAVVTPAGDPGRTPSNPFDYSNVTVTSNSATYNAGSDI